MWPGARLCVVRKYCHLGGIVHHSGSLLPEVKSRVGQAWTAFRQRRIFGSAYVDARDKATLFESVVLSALSFATGIWSLDKATDLAPIQPALLQMARIMLKPRYSFEQACHLPPVFVFALARIPQDGTILHVERLRHFALLVRLGPPELWAILHAEKVWLRARESVQWLLILQQLRAAGRECPETWEVCLGVIKRVSRAVEVLDTEEQTHCFARGKMVC